MLSEGHLGVCLRGRVHRVRSLPPGSLRTCPEVCGLGDYGSWAFMAQQRPCLGQRTSAPINWGGKLFRSCQAQGLQLWNLRPGPPWFWPYLALFYVANAQFGPSAPCYHRCSKPKPQSGHCLFLWILVSFFSPFPSHFWASQGAPCSSISPFCQDCFYLNHCPLRYHGVTKGFRQLRLLSCQKIPFLKYRSLNHLSLLNHLIHSWKFCC